MKIGDLIYYKDNKRDIGTILKVKTHICKKTGKVYIWDVFVFWFDGNDNDPVTWICPSHLREIKWNI